jgi:hypothetical protein
MTPRIISLCSIALVLTLISPGIAGAQSAAKSGGIEPEADRVLREMSDWLAGLGSYAVQTETMVDFVLDSGQKIQLSHRRSVKVNRPDRLAAEVDGDDIRRKLWYNGETLTFFDVDHNVYAVTPAPDTITGMIEFVQKKLEIQVPLADLLAPDPYAVLTREVKTGVYLGRHRVGNRKCHHLAFTQENADWQIWVDATGSPAPRKVVITYKKQPAEPQYTAMILRFDDSMDLPDEVFEFTPPESAVEVEFALPEETSAPATGGGEK